MEFLILWLSLIASAAFWGLQLALAGKLHLLLLVIDGADHAIAGPKFPTTFLRPRA